MMSFSWVGPNNLSHGGTEIRNSLHFVQRSSRTLMDLNSPKVTILD